jgi:hypothetical protein
MSARSEGVIQVGDREVRILFTNRALARFEQQSDKSTIGVMRGLVDGTCGVADVAQLLREGMDAARRDARERRQAIRMSEAYDVLDEAGFAKVMQVVGEAVGAVLSYSGEDDEEFGDDEDEALEKN